MWCLSSDSGEVQHDRCSQGLQTGTERRLQFIDLVCDKFGDSEGRACRILDQYIADDVRGW